MLRAFYSVNLHRKLKNARTIGHFLIYKGYLFYSVICNIQPLIRMIVIPYSELIKNSFLYALGITCMYHVIIKIIGQIQQDIHFYNIPQSDRRRIIIKIGRISINRAIAVIRAYGKVIRHVIYRVNFFACNFRNKLDKAFIAHTLFPLSARSHNAYRQYRRNK